MDQGDEQEEGTGANLSSQDPSRFRLGQDMVADELRCVQCDAPVADGICGRKSFCPACGFPYPLGDCSDLAEN